MMTMRRFDGGGAARKAPPRPGHRPARPWILIALALAALGLEGCQSLQTINPFNPCNRGKCSLGRLFHRKTVEACEPGCEAGGCEAGGISAGVPVETLPAPGAVITTPGPGALPAPPPADVEVPDLAPAEPAPPAGGNGTSSTRGADKSSYQTTLRDGSRTSRRPSATRGHYTPPRPDPPPARRDDASPAVQLLDSLPPPAEEIPMGVTSTPPSPASAPSPTPRATPGPAPSSGPQPVPAASVPSPPPAPVQEEAAAAAAPGIRRFKVVEPQLAGGSFPADAGWDWLVESGYKTILDLREPAEVRPQEVAAIDHRGLRYVALPIAPATIDAARVDRFRQEIAQAGARPLYFCDTDGARAGVLWYIRRVGFDKVDPASARREAEEIGRLDPKLLLAAEAYLARLNPPTPASGPPPTASTSTVVEPLPPRATTEPAPPPVEPVPPAAAPPAAASAASAAAAPHDPTAWRPYAALLLTVLAVPLAYWSRTGLTLRTRPRASLPGSARRPKSLPPASGA